MVDTWTVVKFEEENSVEAVPTTWLLGRDHCYWPPFTQDKIHQAIKKHDQPSTCWPLHKIEVFKSGTYDNYLQARNKARKAENESDLNSDYDKNKRRVRRRKKLSSDESSKSSADELETISWNKKVTRMEISSPPKMPTSLGTGDLTQGRSQLDKPVPVEISAPSPVSNELTCCCCTIHKNGETMKNVLKQQILMRNILTQVLDEIQNLKIPQQLTNTVETIRESVFVTFNFFPINNDEQLNLVEIYLENQTNFKATVDEFSKIGGTCIYDFIRRCLNITISNSFASLFSWHGAKKKKVFGDLKLAKMLLGASERTNLTASQKETEDAIKKWLRRAKERSQQKQYSALG